MRIISLVPSLTETLFALGLSDQEIIGRTPWCIHPQPAVESVPVVGGTKTPNLRKIERLQPDLVVLDREENRREAYDALHAAGLQTWVSQVERPADVPAMIRSLGAITDRSAAAEDLAATCESALAGTAAAAAPSENNRPRAIALIWHDPWMALAPSKYGGALMQAAGFDVPDPLGGNPSSHNGYPPVTPADLAALNLDWLLLPSEPHEFTQAEGDAIANAIASAHPAGRRPSPRLIDGEALTWFGARTAASIADLRRLCDDCRDAERP